MTAQTTITSMNLPQLTLAPENARSGVKYDIAGVTELAASMRAMHRLTGRAVIEPLKAYPTKKGGAVWDGGRRLAALSVIGASDAASDQAIIASIPVILTTKEEALIASLATFVREAMHPADQFLGWNGLFDAGYSADQIAVTVGVSPREVEKLLRFRMLAPVVLQAFRDGRFDFDVALAFTLTDDHDKQLAVLASFGDKAMNDWQVRSALKAKTVDATDRRARFVGREAYAAAGGRFITDLFTHDMIDEDWADEDLLQRLFDAKLAGVIAELEAEGWASVVQAGDRWGQGWREGLDVVHPEGEDNTFTPEQIAASMALVTFDYQGDMDIKRGFVKASRSASLGSTVVPPSKTDPARFGFGHKGHHTMTAIATTATQAAMIDHPAVAYDATVAHLAWRALNPHSHTSSASTLAVPYSYSRSPAGQAVHDALDEWRGSLPDDRLAFLPAVAALSADDKARLLAVAFAATLDVIQDKVMEKPGADWSDLGWMARQCEVDFAAAWTPSEDFFRGGNREALLTVMADVGKTVGGDTKKARLVEEAAYQAREKTWVPQLLRDLVTTPGDAPAPKKARKAKG